MAKAHGRNIVVESDCLAIVNALEHNASGTSSSYLNLKDILI